LGVATRTSPNYFIVAQLVDLQKMQAQTISFCGVIGFVLVGLFPPATAQTISFC
jgi:hypothetical protein